LEEAPSDDSESDNDLPRDLTWQNAHPNEFFDDGDKVLMRKILVGFKTVPGLQDLIFRPRNEPDLRNQVLCPFCKQESQWRRDTSGEDDATLQNVLNLKKCSKQFVNYQALHSHSSALAQVACKCHELLQYYIEAAVAEIN